MVLVIDKSRLAKITALDGGSHEPGASMCAMEAAAYIAGEPWSDHPECVCPVIAAFMRPWNDALQDSERTALLLPLIAKTIGTKGSDALAQRRALMAADWLVRVNTPAWLRLAGLTVHADALAALPEITSFAQVPSIRGPIEAARTDATAAWDAVRAAAQAAAWTAGVAAAWATGITAAWNVAWTAAWDTAWAAAWDTVGAAVRVAAGVAGVAAADQKLAATKAELQASAVQLIERMCDLGEAAE